MKTAKWSGAVAAILTALCLAGTASAQTKPLQTWRPPEGEPDPAKRIPPPAEDTTATPSATSESQAATWQSEADRQSYVVRGDSRERSGSGAFIGASVGKGWVFESVDQSARQISAGYRWQAGPVSRLGVEVTAGKLSSTTRDMWQYGAVDYASVGFTGRFNFGRYSPVYGLVRAGYWAADSSVDDGAYRADVDGGYFGVGLGTDIGERFSLSLVFTSYVYFNELYWEGNNLVYDANRADTLMLGGEFRF